MLAGMKHKTMMNLASRRSRIMMVLAAGLIFAGSAAEFTVTRDQFPAGFENLRLKHVVVQALDDHRRGVASVALEVRKTGTSFSLTRTTAADGFTEDLAGELPGLPPAERIDLLGAYSVRLVDPGQASGLAELLLFFMYQVQEV